MLFEHMFVCLYDMFVNTCSEFVRARTYVRARCFPCQFVVVLPLQTGSLKCSQRELHALSCMRACMRGCMGVCMHERAWFVKRLGNCWWFWVHVRMFGVREHGCSENICSGPCLHVWRVRYMTRNSLFMFGSEHENTCSVYKFYLHVREPSKTSIVYKMRYIHWK